MGKLKEILCFCFCCGEKNASSDIENLNSSSETDRSVENQQRVIKRSIGVQAEITVTHARNESPTNHLNEKSNDTINVSYKLGTKITNFDGIDYFKGNFGKRTVTIKRILHSLYNTNEIERLKILDDHENILRYFNTFKDNFYFYIIMDEFGVSLEQFVFNKINQIAGLEENLMQQLTSVVGFIHKKDIYSLNLNVFNIQSQRRNDQFRKQYDCFYIAKF
ncbi:CLUMA_CG010815, isoform A [Clunio marinus]|uniref:CLUMA_CG010815, isoform A n=1 Tax=Clunio marinus TaxID=568069 RepID=A0A1J1ICE6_9DIPT|nr:CLUMA_CG010815, isoform A [Clunio marinus]